MKYIGHTDFAAGIWIGLELRNPKGKTLLAVISSFYIQATFIPSIPVAENGIVSIQSRKTQWSRTRSALLHLQGEPRGDGSTKVSMRLMLACGAHGQGVHEDHGQYDADTDLKWLIPN